MSLISCATVSHPAVPLGVSDARFGTCHQEAARDALGSSKRQAESHQKQILAQVSPNTKPFLPKWLM